MADTTYQPKVYLKQGAEDFIVASGGQAIVESGGEVEIESGGELSVESGGVVTLESGGKITAESGGEFEGQSGATFDAQSGFGFYLVDTTYTADKLNNYLTGINTKTILINSAGLLSAGGGSAPPILVSTGGLYLFYLDSVASNASARMFSAHSGQRVRLDGKYMTSVASIFILASGNGLSGVSIQGIRNSALTSILIAAGANGNNFPYVDLLCITDGCWTIVDKSSAGVTEYPT